MNDMHDAQPLAGIKVIDFTQVMLGPCCTQMLGDYGADVIKIERIGAGDLSRSVDRGSGRAAQSGVLQPQSQQAQHRAGPEIAGRDWRSCTGWSRRADVVVNNFRAGVMERMGLGYDALSRINPRIIFAFGTGFGTEGPYSHKGGQDVLAQAMSGVMARKCDPSEPLTIYPTALADYSAGMHLVQGILLALLQRERTGRGPGVAVSLYDSMLAMQMQEAAMWLMRGRDFSWGAMPHTGAFETTDGALVIVGAFKANPLREISLALGLDDLSEDPRFDTFEKSRAQPHRAARHSARPDRAPTAPRTGSRDWKSATCCAHRCKRLGEALADPQTEVNGMLVRTGWRADPLGLVGSPVHLSAGGFALRHTPPALGADGAAILAEFGFTPQEIAGLRAEGVVA